jgi:CubicO group peptidase (beta-lactamase class C family)
MPADTAAALERFPPAWVESGEVTAVFAAVATPGGTVWSGAASRDGEPRPSSRSLFDAASLTKPWIATLALRLAAAGGLALATRVGEVWPGADARLATRSLRDLLAHRAGLAAWTPLYRRCRSRQAVERLLVSGSQCAGAEAAPARRAARRRGSPRSSAPPRPGSEAAYSDLDYILWGLAAERRLGRPLADLLRRELLAPLGIDGVEVAPGNRSDVVRCHCDNGREVALAAAQDVRVSRRPPPHRGEPQDGNARFLGGLAGHAGLFVSAEAMLALGRGWLGALSGDARMVDPAWAEGALAGSSAYALGWARRRVAGSAGPALPASAFGHIGFTGSSLWIDPDRGAMYLLLAHRAVAEGSLQAARRRFHALAAAHVGAAVRTGGAEAEC